jgi:hypothetical protein
MKFIRDFSVLSDFTVHGGKIITSTCWVLEYQGSPDELQAVWDWICLQKKGSTWRQPIIVDPKTQETLIEFGFSDKGAAAMVRLVHS